MNTYKTLNDDRFIYECNDDLTSDNHYNLTHERKNMYVSQKIY